MTRRYSGVLLDVDGTLVDSNDAHAGCWVEAFAHFGVIAEYARIRRMIGMGGDRMIDEVARVPKDSQRSKDISTWRDQRFLAHWLSQVRRMPHVREFLLRLRDTDYKYVLATSARDTELDAILDRGGIHDLCHARASSSEVDASKPAPDVVEAALVQVGVDRDRAVMIGDTPYDVIAGRRADVDVIGMTTGGWTPDELAGTVAVFDGPAGILAHWAKSPFA